MIRWSAGSPVSPISSAREIAVSAAFYRDVFGWKLHGQADKPSFSDGTGHVIGRWVTDQAITGTDGLRAYVYVADVDDTLAAVTTHGGQIVTPPYPEGTLRVALFADPPATSSESGRKPQAAKGTDERHPTS